MRNSMNKNNLVFFWFNGYDKIKVLNYDPVSFLKFCKAKEITLWNIKFENYGMECCILRKDTNTIKDILEKKQGKIEILNEKGFPMICLYVKPHFSFFIMMLVTLCLLYYSQNFVWRFSIDGNLQNTSDQIVDFLCDEEIYVGNQKKEIDCDELEQKIRDHFDNVTWTSVYMTGTTLEIHMKEKETKEYKIKHYDNIVAPCDGKIESIFIHSGNPLVRIGDKIAEGDILVNSDVPVFNEELEVVGFQFQVPEAEIKISSMIQYYEKMNRKNRVIEYEDPINSYTYYVCNHQVYPKRKTRMKNTYYESIRIYNNILSIPKLCFSISKNEEFYRIISYHNIVYTDDELKQKMLDNLSKYILCLQRKGVQFVEKNVKIDKNRDSMEITAELYIIETIS